VLAQGPGEEVKYKVELLPAEGAVQVSEGGVSVLVSLTSAVMREPNGKHSRPARPVELKYCQICTRPMPPSRTRRTSYSASDLAPTVRFAIFGSNLNILH
jgi:hypothetical protein